MTCSIVPSSYLSDSECIWFLPGFSSIYHDQASHNSLSCKWVRDPRFTPQVIDHVCNIEAHAQYPRQGHLAQTRLSSVAIQEIASSESGLEEYVKVRSVYVSALRAHVSRFIDAGEVTTKATIGDAGPGLVSDAPGTIPNMQMCSRTGCARIRIRRSEQHRLVSATKSIGRCRLSWHSKCTREVSMAFKLFLLLSISVILTYQEVLLALVSQSHVVIHVLTLYRCFCSGNQSLTVNSVPSPVLPRLLLPINSRNRNAVVKNMPVSIQALAFASKSTSVGAPASASTPALPLVIRNPLAHQVNTSERFRETLAVISASESTMGIESSSAR